MKAGGSLWGAGMRRARFAVLLAAIGILIFSPFRPPALGASDSPAAPSGASGSAEPQAIGPYVANTDVLEILDRQDPGGDCAKSGPLSFGCLVQAKAIAEAHEAPIGALANPFNLNVLSQIRKTIQSDLAGFRTEGEASSDQQINPGFLTHPASRLELVGIINRIDRQFIDDVVPGSEDRKRCGEISLIYRFSYSLAKGAVSSRLPVTVNVVFPAVPHARPAGAATCGEIAARWTMQMQRPASDSAAETAARLMDPKTGVASLLDGHDIERIEFNIQAYRISAQSDKTDLGSTAKYVLRVFRWDPGQKRFMPSYLTDQIDRARLLGNDKGDDNSCDPGVDRPMSKARFLRYLLSPAVLSDIDTGTLNIPKQYLACRAITVSPGGPYRSANALFWNALDEREQLLSDAAIDNAIRNARTAKRQFSFMATADDFRLRLDELSCTGCHQTRAIAGFHFPGADRSGTAVSNAVFLAGSPHFYGDQVRRTQILDRLAKGEFLTRYALATSYASRPLNKFKTDLAGTQLIGGWGSACLMPEASKASQRKWDCHAGLKCEALFSSRNAPGMGTCVPDGLHQIGDALQTGEITSTSFGKDKYLRQTPARVGDWNDKDHRDTRIPESSLPSPAPADNSYYGSHQEFYTGRDPTAADPPEEQNKIKRDALTGGFPSGMLRLSECTGLPPEATCGLVASSGFNDCIGDVGSGKKTLAQCFRERTSYAGLRACDIADPCRDDYICLRPLEYTAANGHAKFEERSKTTPYKPDDFGQKEPDAAWLSRNGGGGDQRGICIPPYFVFQFRSDGHPSPMSAAMSKTGR